MLTANTLKKQSALTVLKQVPADRLQAYLDIGWSFQGTHDTANLGIIRKLVTTWTGRDELEQQAWRAPHLVKRARIRKPRNDYKGATLSQSVNMDYMGAAEFEWGALPQSLRVVQAQKSLYNRFKADRISKVLDDGSVAKLLYYANFDTTEQFEQYEEWLLDVINGKRHMKESLRMSVGTEVGGEYDPDFWWDIRNHVFMSFDKDYMKRLPQHLDESFRVMS